MAKKPGSAPAAVTAKLDLAAQVASLKEENVALSEKATRALADYQNLVRRQQEEQARVVEYARITIFSSLLPALAHLSLAAQNLHDSGLDMVVKQFWTELNNQGLQEYSPFGEKFDPQSMEVVTQRGEGDQVLAVLSPGYKLNQQVIQVAKVEVGSK